MPIDDIHLSLEDWLSESPASHARCFLCGVVLDEHNSTDEHILPQWVLRDFDLMNKPMTLPNKTTIPYPQLRIPCCQTCNNGPLSAMETDVSHAVRSGFDVFAKLPKLRVFQWVQCIAYKLLFKELQLKEDRKDPKSGTIMEPFHLGLLRLSHLFLRTVDQPVLFGNFFPSSIYLFRLKTSADRQKNFDYIDAIPEQCIAIRVNDVGIIAVLNDSELQQLAMPWMFEKVIDNTLSPVQFRNAFGKVLYPQRIFKDPFIFQVVKDDAGQIVISRQMRGVEGGNVYGEWNMDDYAETLGAVLGCHPDAIKLPDGTVGSLFFDKDANWKDRDFDDDGFLPTTSTECPT